MGVGVSSTPSTCTNSFRCNDTSCSKRQGRTSTRQLNQNCRLLYQLWNHPTISRLHINTKRKTWRHWKFIWVVYLGLYSSGYTNQLSSNFITHILSNCTRNFTVYVVDLPSDVQYFRAYGTPKYFLACLTNFMRRFHMRSWSENARIRASSGSSRRFLAFFSCFYANNHTIYSVHHELWLSTAN